MIYVTDEIAAQPWFVGKLTREEAEKRLKAGDRAGSSSDVAFDALHITPRRSESLETPPKQISPRSK